MSKLDIYLLTVFLLRFLYTFYCNISKNQYINYLFKIFELIVKGVV